MKGGLNTFVPKIANNNNNRQNTQNQNGALMCVQGIFEVAIFGMKTSEDELIQSMIMSKVRHFLHFFGILNTLHFRMVD